MGSIELIFLNDSPRRSLKVIEGHWRSFESWLKIEIEAIHFLRIAFFNNFKCLQLTLNDLKRPAMTPDDL